MLSFIIICLIFCFLSCLGKCILIGVSKVGFEFSLFSLKVFNLILGIFYWVLVILIFGMLGFGIWIFGLIFKFVMVMVVLLFFICIISLVFFIIFCVLGGGGGGGVIVMFNLCIIIVLGCRLDKKCFSYIMLSVLMSIVLLSREGWRLYFIEFCFVCYGFKVVIFIVLVFVSLVLFMIFISNLEWMVLFIWMIIGCCFFINNCLMVECILFILILVLLYIILLVWVIVSIMVIWLSFCVDIVCGLFIFILVFFINIVEMIKKIKSIKIMFSSGDILMFCVCWFLRCCCNWFVMFMFFLLWCVLLYY